MYAFIKGTVVGKTQSSPYDLCVAVLKRRCKKKTINIDVLIPRNKHSQHIAKNLIQIGTKVSVRGRATCRARIIDNELVGQTVIYAEELVILDSVLKE
jgi:NADH/NAD ratio-sensing transcriptional regulator Rex